jgi:cellobiose-specific phosphotransferase system component IIC
MLQRALELVREATKAVPAVRYALGITGVMAAFALGASLFKDVGTAIYGTLIMIALMVLLLVFAAATRQGGRTGSDSSDCDDVGDNPSVRRVSDPDGLSCLL